MQTNSRHYDIQSRPFNPLEGARDSGQTSPIASIAQPQKSGPAMRMQKDHAYQPVGNASISKNLAALKRYTMIARFVAEAKYQDPTVDPVNLTRQVTEAASTQAQRLASVIGGEGLPWVISTLTATVATEMHQALFTMTAEQALAFDWVEALSPTSEIEAPLAYEPHHGNADSRISLTIALQRAVLTLQRAHSQNNLFHQHWDLVARWATEQISESVASVLEEPEIQSILRETANNTLVGQSLIRQAGQLLVDTWKHCGADPMREIATTDAETRKKIVSSGYPLEKVANVFKERWSDVAGQLLDQFLGAGKLTEKLSGPDQMG